MINKIVHLADIHIPKSPTRHVEIRQVFSNLYKSLKKTKPDLIVLVGDLFHDFIDIQPEAAILAAELLNELAKIAPVRITRGNHDIRKKTIRRTDSIEAIVKNINNPNVIYYNETGLFDDDNITWAVWKHGDKFNNPWNKKAKTRKEKETDRTFIDLFHDPINGCKTPTGFEMNRKTYNDIEHFRGDYSMFGDIHKLQYFEDKTKAYCGSLFAQNFGEGDYEFHGYLLWDIETGKIKECEIKNDYSFKTVRVNPFTDFDELEIEIDNPTKFMKVRVIWKTKPQAHNDVNTRKVVKHIRETYNPTFITHKNEFIEEDELIIEESVNINNIVEQSVQHEIFAEYLEKIGVEDDLAEEVIKLDDEIATRIETEEFTNIQWSIVKFKAENFMSYENIEVDWRDMNGLFQISGLNTAGKTTIMKLITYILYNKSRETEKTMKFGDKRFVNNVLDVSYTTGSIVIEVNGEYFGVKRTTNIEKTKAGDIKGAPTILEYHKLLTPDDELTDDNSLENLIDDERRKTQTVIERAIGSYENFMRIAMTTSDTLNEILSNDKSVFVDSLLYDSGLDIFDNKLNEFKGYSKELASVPRVFCNVEKSEELIKTNEKDVEIFKVKIDELENIKIPEVDLTIAKGEEYHEKLIKKLYKIDDEIYNLNVEETGHQIDTLNYDIGVLELKVKRDQESINELKNTYNEDRLNELLIKKDNHKDEEYRLNDNIKTKNSQLRDVEYYRGKINGDVVRLTEQGSKLKEDIEKLKSNTNCPTCGQLLDNNHQEHLEIQIKEIEEEMYSIGDKIKEKNSGLPKYDIEEKELKEKRAEYEATIITKSLEMEGVLSEIGELTNDKNEVERRRSLESEAEKTPLQIENFNLQRINIYQKVDLYNQSLKQIEENQKINKGIEAAKKRLADLKYEKDNYKDDIYSLNTQKGQKSSIIKDTSKLILTWTEQERQDQILNIYKKCIHRDGIPTQLLKTYAIPKINNELVNLLMDIPFNVWLDEDDLKLKLSYNNNVNGIIDAISASGKERTFASVALKFALNQINMKSKPTLFLLDEVMGKLTEDSVSEFVGVLQAIREKVNKVLIVEHNHFINPDYVIEVTKDENNISTLTIE